MTDMGFEIEFDRDTEDETGDAESPRQKTAFVPRHDAEGWWRKDFEEIGTDDDGDPIWRRRGIEAVENIDFRKLERPAASLDDAPDPAAATDGGTRDG